MSDGLLEYVMPATTMVAIESFEGSEVEVIPLPAGQVLIWPETQMMETRDGQPLAVEWCHSDKHWLWIVRY
jgi:hypothetical protein